MIVGEPPGLISAMLLPATSPVTFVADVDASSRHTLAAGPSNPEGAGVSSRRFRNASEDGLSMSARVESEEETNAEFVLQQMQGQWKRIGPRGAALHLLP